MQAQARYAEVSPGVAVAVLSAALLVGAVGGFSARGLADGAAPAAAADASTSSDLLAGITTHATQERADFATLPSFVQQAVDHAASERAEMADPTAASAFVSGVTRHTTTERIEAGHEPSAR